MNSDYPKVDRRNNNFKLENLLRHYPNVRKYYFDKLSQIMIDQYSENFEFGKLDPWVASENILNNLDHSEVSKENLNQLTWLLQRALVNRFDSHFKYLVVKDMFMKEMFVDEQKKKDNQFKEFTTILLTIQLYRHAMINTIQFMLENDLQGTDFVT